VQQALRLTPTPAYSFACKCGRRQCAATWRDPAEYDMRAVAEPVIAAEHAGRR